MKRMRIVGLCLVAMFALSAVVASTAFAEEHPEFMICGKVAKVGGKYTGKYSSKTCGPKEATKEEQEAGKKNKYERVPYTSAKKKTYKAKNKGEPKNAIVNPLTGGPSKPAEDKGDTECKKEAVVGEVTSATTEKWKTTYSSCKGLGTPCNTKGQKAGVIVTNELEATLVYLNKEHTEVGLRVKGTGKAGGNTNTPELANYECEIGVSVEVFGEVLAKTTGNVDSANKKTTQTVEHGPLDLQSNLYIEGKHTEEEGKQYFEWGSAFKACVKEQAEKGHPIKEAEEICVGKAGGFWESFPETPITLESHVVGAVVEGGEATAPATQNGITEATGEAFLIATK